MNLWKEILLQKFPHSFLEEISLKMEVKLMLFQLIVHGFKTIEKLIPLLFDRVRFNIANPLDFN